MSLFLADLDVGEATTGWQKMSGAVRDVLFVFGILVGLSLVLAFWAAFIRKKKRRRHHHHHHHEHSPEPSPENLQDENPPGDPPDPLKRRKRRRRREHRPRNPTLAETGGLPPLRSDSPPDPPPG